MNLFMVESGAVSILDFRQKNHQLVACHSLELAKILLNTLKPGLPDDETGMFQIISEATFMRNIASFDAEESVARPLPEVISSQLERAVRIFFHIGTCERVDSKNYCPPVEAIGEEEFLERDWDSEEEEFLELDWDSEEDTETYFQPEDSLLPREDSLDITVVDGDSVRCNTGYHNEFAEKIKDTLGSCREILEITAVTLGENEQKLKSVEHQMMDELHFIEFDVEGTGNGQEVYERLHQLRLQRRRLKDDLFLSETVQDLFSEFSPKDFAEIQKRIENLFQRVYRLRAPGGHPQRGL